MACSGSENLNLLCSNYLIPGCFPKIKHQIQYHIEKKKGSRFMTKKLNLGDSSLLLTS